MEFAQFCNQMIAQRRADPRDDLISALVTAHDEGDQLEHSEILAMIFLLLAAGHETTVNLIGNGVVTLLRHPDALEQLRDDPTLIDSAVEEILRYESPVENTLSRTALEEIEWNGVHIKPGEGVFATLLSANRDEAMFDDPHTFDITREGNKHIAFGSGIHYCLGAPLARLEGAIALNALIARHPAMQLTTDSLEWNETITFRGVKALPLRLDGVHP